MDVPGMETQQTEDGITIVVFDTPRIFDPPSIGAMGKALRRMTRQGAQPRFVLDLSRVESVVSAFLGELIGLHSDIVGRGGRVRLCGIRSTVGEILRLLKLDVFFPIDPDRETALQRIREDDAVS